MKKVVFLILLASVAFLIPINAEKSEYSCDTCHEHSKAYTSHVEGGKYCSECHGDIHTTHELECEVCHASNPFAALCHGSPGDLQVPAALEGMSSVCENCHVNLVTIHEGDCQRCHTEDINEIHSKANIFGGGE
jgi:hypothetical protein